MGLLVLNVSYKVQNNSWPMVAPTRPVFVQNWQLVGGVHHPRMIVLGWVIEEWWPLVDYLFLDGLKPPSSSSGASFDQTCWRYQSAMFDIVWLVRACRMNASHHITHHKLQPNQAPILQPVCHHAGICRYPLFFLEWFQGKRTGNCLFWWTHHRGSCRCFHETTYNDF